MEARTSSRSRGARILIGLGRALVLIIQYIAVLLWEAARYVVLTLADFVTTIRVGLLRRRSRRVPPIPAEDEGRIAALHERRIARWRRWRGLSPWRRWQIRFAVISVLIVGGIVAVRWPTHGIMLASGTDSSPVPRGPARQPESEENIVRVKQALGTFADERRKASPGEWLLFSGNPVLSRGALEAWDDFKVGSPVVIKDVGRGADQHRMWYRGCHFIAGEYTCGVGHATSPDGLVWEKSPEPVFRPQDPTDSERLGGIAIVRADGRYLMWYAIAADWFVTPPRYYATINLALSTDGIKWQPAGAVLRTVGKRMAPLEPAALFDGSRFHLWYVDFASPGQPESLLHIVSSDGRQWQLSGATAIDQLGGDPGRLAVLSDGRGGYWALFTRRRTDQRRQGVFGVLTSPDGNVWTAVGGEAAPTRPSSGEDIADSPAVLPQPDGLWVWFILRPQDGADRIGVAYRKGPAS